MNGLRLAGLAESKHRDIVWECSFTYESDDCSPSGRTSPTSRVAAAAASRDAQPLPQPLQTQVAQRHAPSYVTYPYIKSGYRTGGTFSDNLWSGLTTWHAGACGGRPRTPGPSTCAPTQPPPSPHPPNRLRWWLVACVGGWWHAPHPDPLPPCHYPAETVNVWTMLLLGAVSVALLAHTLWSFALGWQAALPFYILTLATLVHVPSSVRPLAARGMRDAGTLQA
jgi:hypothetical protein